MFCFIDALKASFFLVSVEVEDNEPLSFTKTAS